MSVTDRDLCQAVAIGLDCCNDLIDLRKTALSASPCSRGLLREAFSDLLEDLARMRRVAREVTLAFCDARLMEDPSRRTVRNEPAAWEAILAAADYVVFSICGFLDSDELDATIEDPLGWLASQRKRLANLDDEQIDSIAWHIAESSKLDVEEINKIQGELKVEYATALGQAEVFSGGLKGKDNGGTQGLPTSKEAKNSGTANKKNKGGRRKKGATTCNAAMLDLMQRDYDRVAGWTAKEWSKEIGFSDSAVTATPTWENLAIARERLKAEKAKDRRRGKGN